jgi:hypothetical protein
MCRAVARRWALVVFWNRLDVPVVLLRLFIAMRQTFTLDWLYCLYYKLPLDFVAHQVPQPSYNPLIYTSVRFCSALLSSKSKRVRVIVGSNSWFWWFVLTLASKLDRATNFALHCTAFTYARQCSLLSCCVTISCSTARWSHLPEVVFFLDSICDGWCRRCFANWNPEGIITLLPTVLDVIDKLNPRHVANSVGSLLNLTDSLLWNSSQVIESVEVQLPSLAGDQNPCDMVNCTIWILTLCIWVTNGQLVNEFLTFSILSCRLAISSCMLLAVTL